MATADITPFSFMHGSIQDAQVLRVAAQIDEITDTGADETEVMMYSLSTRKWLSRTVEFRVIALTTLPGKPPTLVAMGMGGDVMAGNAQGAWEEHVDDTDDGPRRRGDIRTVTTVGQEVYAAGMGRQLYRREGKGRWVRADEGLVQPRGTLQVSGLNAIDGTGNGDLVGVGFLGEIWERRQGAWSPMDSPTNLILHDVKILGPRLTVACGQEGTLLAYQDTAWEPLEQQATEADIWSLDRFGDQVFFGAEDGLYVTRGGGPLEKVDVGEHSDDPFRRVHCHAGLILAVGTKVVLISKDGRKWQDITP